MRQNNNQLFHLILKKTKKSLLNKDNIAILNRKIATTMLVGNSQKNVIVV